MGKAIIIGAGIGGIATALRLRSKGYSVRVFEASDSPGGKLSSRLQAGFRFDMGPSLFTMPHFVDELFQLFEKNPRDYFDYEQEQTICNYFWEDGTTFKAQADREQFIDMAGVVFGEKVEYIEAYLDRNKKKYDLTSKLFLERSLHKLSSYLSYDAIKAMSQFHKLHLFLSLDAATQIKFNNPKLIQFFNRFATYNGSSPFQTPGIMSMIPHLEMHYGTFFPKGGMISIVSSLFQLANEEGIEFIFNEPIERIRVQNKKAIGLESKSGYTTGDLIVSNMDVYPTYRKLLKEEPAPERILKQERSSSALNFYWGINREFQQLGLHNILFSDHYHEEFRSIFKEKTIMEDPTIYINISSKNEKEDAPAGCENWFVMINAPGDYGQDWEKLKAKARTAIIQKINRILKVDIEEHIVTEFTWDPPGIEQDTSSYRGALYGAASNKSFAAFLRHPNFSRKIDQLYFCGGSVHPGGGIPLCLLSAKIVSDLIPETA